MGLFDRFRRSSAPSSPEVAEVAEASEVADAPAGAPAPADSPVPAAAEPASAAPPPVDQDRTRLGPWLDLPVSELADHPSIIADIYAGTLDGVSIRGVFTPEEVASAVAKARTHVAEFRDHGKTIMFGTALVGSADDRSDYFADSPAMTERLRELFDVDFAGRVAEVISACAGGLPASVPVEEGRGAYVPATIRFLPPGRGVMHAHTANEFCNNWGAYGHLRSIAEMWNSLSYFVVGQAADSGGDLALYDLMWDDTPDDVLALGMSEERDALLERFGSRPVRLGPGDMIVFTGGRIWHRVEPVVGETDRVTIGGFVARSLDGEQVFYWS